MSVPRVAACFSRTAFRDRGYRSLAVFQRKGDHSGSAPLGSQSSPCASIAHHVAELPDDSGRRYFPAEAKKNGCSTVWVGRAFSSGVLQPRWLNRWGDSCCALKRARHAAATLTRELRIGAELSETRLLASDAFAGWTPGVRSRAAGPDGGCGSLGQLLARRYRLTAPSRRRAAEITGVGGGCRSVIN